ncbi:UDP-N-acetylmuramate:L-alanyl-gamma-D-glutamyl-meso-diaminopimelate ligase [Deltaproteobacteria bacterium Smac51]|nr:UDP-N-acetylmuramate:L-alanyl-gamma-D-glutamyl-meso-diaminopimelate ligase [Deltaproteobacteria bacterium Smac51]
MFELDHTLNTLPPDFLKTAGKDPSKLSVHLIGIGGVAMTALAGLLKEAGFKVTGSDSGLYPPMSDILKEIQAAVFDGYGPETLPLECDLVVVGNVVTRQFPVLEAVKERRLHYLSLPQTLGALFMNRTRNVVVAGSHGKTTTTALAARIWDEAGLRPGFLIGGAALDFPRPWRISGGEWFIIEGDEYDSAFFNKVPKFIHYRPHTVILTSVEFDHADIYPDLNAVAAAFESLMKLIPPDGRLIAWGDDPLVRKVAAVCPAPVEFYGLNEDNDWRVVAIEENGGGSDFELIGPGGFYARLSLPRPGVYNVLNAAAASAAFVGSGGDGRCLGLALAGFQGVKRRQEVLGNLGGILLVDDFAHHPTAVEKTIAALKRAHPGRRLLAAFEPRSNTSRRAVFQKDYVRALGGADRVFLRLPPSPEKSPEGDRLDGRLLAADLGPKASLFEDGLSLGRAVVEEARPGDLVVIMSNGGFDGLAEYLCGRLGQK